MKNVETEQLEEPRFNLHNAMRADANDTNGSTHHLGPFNIS